MSDIHLGYRAYTKETDRGRNAREVDVEEAWFHAVEATIAEKPELVTIAGDIFHHPRVSDFAKRAFLVGVRRIMDRSGAFLIIEQGNHDAGRTSDVLTPIALAEGWDQRIHVVTTPKRINLQCGPEKVSVACFPFVTREQEANYRLDPDPDANVNILLVHAAVKGSAEGDALPYFYGSGQSLDVGREADRWDAVICGDYHEYTRLHPERLAFYSGSIERTSNNVWAEHAEKGIVVYDTATGEMLLRQIPTRDMVDTAWRSSVAPTATALNAVMADMLGAYNSTIARFKVEAFPREQRELIDWALVRQLKSECQHFYLDIRYKADEVEDLGDRRDRQALSLGEEAAAFFKDDREEVRDLAISFLDVEADVEDALEEVEL
jgi:DNA repair exonuclease SbcCD nuclease subunit